VAHTELVVGGTLSLPQLIARMSHAPAAVFSLPEATLRPGAPADLVVLDITTPWTVDPATFFSKSRNTPFVGRSLTGRAVLTLVGGTIVHDAAVPTGR
jgi:dihydroorotase